MLHESWRISECAIYGRYRRRRRGAVAGCTPLPSAHVVRGAGVCVHRWRTLTRATTRGARDAHLESRFRTFLAVFRSCATRATRRSPRSTRAVGSWPSRASTRASRRPPSCRTRASTRRSPPPRGDRHALHPSKAPPGPRGRRERRAFKSKSNRPLEPTWLRTIFKLLRKFSKFSGSGCSTAPRC